MSKTSGTIGTTRIKQQRHGGKHLREFAAVGV